MTSTSIDIDRPADDVFDYATDPTQFHEWQQGVVSMTWRGLDRRHVSGGMKEPGTPTAGSECRMTLVRLKDRLESSSA